MRMVRSFMPVVIALAAIGCGDLAPESAALPPEISAFLGGDGATFSVEQRQDGAIDLPPTAAMVKARELHDVVGFQGIPAAPIYGRLACSPVGCPAWIGGPQPVRAWLVWFPTDLAFVFIDARTGQILRAAVTIRGTGEWSVVL